MLPLVGSWVWPDSLILIAAIIVTAVILNYALRRAIRLAVKRTKVFARKAPQSRAMEVLAAATGVDHERTERRAETIGSLLQTVVTVVLWLVVILTILDSVGVPMMSVLASAGIGGVALAFGAQSLVKDVLSGVFMIFEDQYGVGDFIDTGTVQGTVEDISLRVTRLRDLQGGVWYVRNGEITRIGNQSQGWATGLLLVPIAPDEDSAKAIEILEQVAADFDADPEWSRKLIECPTVAGVTSVDASAQQIQVSAKCPATEQHAVRRELLARSVRALNDAGVRGPRLGIVE